MNLIKKYDPKYNVMLKDDKTYPFIKITHEVQQFFRFPRRLHIRIRAEIASFVFFDIPGDNQPRSCWKMIKPIPLLKSPMNAIRGWLSPGMSKKTKDAIFFNQIHFQNKRFKIGGSHDIFKVLNLRHKPLGFCVVMNLIKKYDPKYNVMLKDDKTYPFIKITHERHPRLTACTFGYGPK
jgi:hypothetical protein